MALPATILDVDKIDASVARHYRVGMARLREHGHRAGAAKAVAVELARRLTGLTGRAVGLHHDGITSAAVSNIRRKIREDASHLLPEVERLTKKLRGTESC